MEKKQSEADLAKMMNAMGVERNGEIWLHKWADMRYCPNCHSLMYKTENAVDYTIIVGNIAGLVECKQGIDRMPWADEDAGIRPGQRVWLNQWTLLNRPCWMFLELGDGRAPKDRNAWLVPWVNWVMVEETLDIENKKSLPWRKTTRSGLLNAENMLSLWRMDWVTNKGFTIPKNHIFWLIYPQIKYT